MAVACADQSSIDAMAPDLTEVSSSGDTGDKGTKDDGPSGDCPDCDPLTPRQMNTLLNAAQFLCEELRGPMTRAIQGGEFTYASQELEEFAWHRSDHKGGTHYVVTPRALGSAYWGTGQNMAWLMAHEYGHHVLYYPLGEEEAQANAFATKCMNYNALIGY